eukprot:150058_1
MAFSKTKLNKVPSRNKDLVFGFMRKKEHEWNNDILIPQLMRYLSLLYFNPNKDEFDVKYTHPNIEQNNYCITNKDVFLNPTSYLTNIVNKRKHIWRFKINEYDEEIAIGIHNSKFERGRLGCYFDNTIQDESKTPTGYGISLDGRMTNANNPTEWGQRTQIICLEDDIIEMILDFNELTLSYKVNDRQYNSVFDIIEGKYRASVTLCRLSSVTLLSYQDFY